jgi:hypothetical protein
MEKSPGHHFVDSPREDRKVQLIIEGLKRPTRQSPKGCLGIRLLTSSGKSKFSRLSLVMQGHLGQAGKVRKKRKNNEKNQRPKLRKPNWKTN